MLFTHLFLQVCQLIRPYLIVIRPILVTINIHSTKATKYVALVTNIPFIKFGLAQFNFGLLRRQWKILFFNNVLDNKVSNDGNKEKETFLLVIGIKLLIHDMLKLYCIVGPYTFLSRILCILHSTQGLLIFHSRGNGRNSLGW